MKELVFATHNRHKLDEARKIMGSDYNIKGLHELGCDEDIPETSGTLEGNALQKARWVRDRYGMACFSDDTGLMVDALEGAPGVYSARYAGEHCSPDDNIDKLLAQLGDTAHRSARFITVVAFVDDDGSEHVFKGVARGSIAKERQGHDGFGYDPVFISDETGRSFAAMSADEKNAISHRGRAMKKFKQYLQEL